jgi:hypothetical protein
MLGNHGKRLKGLWPARLRDTAELVTTLLQHLQGMIGGVLKADLEVGLYDHQIGLYES